MNARVLSETTTVRNKERIGPTPGRKIKGKWDSRQLYKSTRTDGGRDDMQEVEERRDNKR